MSKHDVTIIFEDGRSVRVKADEAETVYLACLKNKVRILTDCLEGACATCKGHCPSGAYRLDGHSEEALSEDEAAERKVLACQMHALGDCVIEFPYDSKIALKSEPKSWPCRVVSADKVSSTVCRLVIEPEDGPQDIGFLPGQYVHLRIPGTDQSRDYSFANAPGETGRFTFYIKLLDDGAMSRYVAERARPGDAIAMTGPFGRFYLRPPVRPVLMIAGGTGLAPMLSMLDHLAGNGGTDQPVRLLFGVNVPDELFGLDQLAGYRDRGIALSLDLAAVAGGDGWTGATGHVTGLLHEGLVAGDTDVYLCGPPPMIEAGTAWLARHGVDERRIHTEKFLPS